MLKFLIDKFRDFSGPLKGARLVVGDVFEEVVDLAGHYAQKLRRSPQTAADETAPQPVEAQPAPVVEPVEKKPPQKTTKSTKPASKAKKAASPGKKTKSSKKAEPVRTIEVPDELAAALDNAANRRKQEFKVLTILWDTRNRNMGGMSAKALSEHGLELGLAIRHENIRKVIKMRLSNYVEILHEHGDRASINNYRLTDEGMAYFKDTYLS